MEVDATRLDPPAYGYEDLKTGLVVPQWIMTDGTLQFAEACLTPAAPRKKWTLEDKHVTQLRETPHIAVLEMDKGVTCVMRVRDEYVYWQFRKPTPPPTPTPRRSPRLSLLPPPHPVPSFARTAAGP